MDFCWQSDGGAAMEMAWYIYTIAILFVAIIACSVSVMVWVLVDRKSWLVAAAAFACYVFETAIIFFTEYSGEKPYVDEYFNQGLQWPAVSLSLCITLLTLVWTWVMMRAHAPVTKRRVITFAAIFGAVILLVAPVGDLSNALRNYLYWGARDLTFIGTLAYAGWYTMRRATENERADALRAKGFYKLVCVLSVVMFLEDTFFIMIYTPTAEVGTVAYEFFWHITERNLTENVIMVCCSVRQIMNARELMRVFAQHPAENAGATTGEDRQLLESDIDLRLPGFCDAYGMSRREREVVRLILLEKSTQEIANELVLSVGTVKAHLHRIYTKAGVSGRQELVKLFWRS